MHPDELELFAASVRQAVDGRTGAALDKALDDIGWPDALAAWPAAAVQVLFEAQGRAGATSAALHSVLLTGLGLEPSGAALLLPPLDNAGVGIVIDGRLQVRGLTAPADELLVPADDGDKDVVVRVAVTDLSVRPVAGIDPAAGLVSVEGEVLAASEPVPGSWQHAVALGHRALASELVGCGRTMLELARAHALDREQFGRPIAAFQAVRHRLADTLVALEAADDLIRASWEDGSAMSAAMAKALAGRSARTAARHCQQVLAGIGFTTEHRLHLYVRRVLLLDQLLGSSRTLTRQLGQDLLANRSLPPLLPL